MRSSTAGLNRIPYSFGNPSGNRYGTSSPRALRGTFISPAKKPLVMHEYGPGIVGEVRFARLEGGYYVQLYDREGNPVGKTGLWRTEAKAREAARKLAEKLARK